MRSFWRDLVVFAIVALPVAIFAQGSSSLDPQFISEIKSTDPATVEKGVADLKQLESSNAFTKSIGLEIKGLTAALNASQFDPVYELARNGLLKQFNTPALGQDMLRLMCQAKLGLGKPDEALSLAKTYYAYCQMEQTRNAIDLLVGCMIAADKDHGAGSAQSLRSQQTAGSTPTADPPSADAAKANALANIPYNADVVAAATDAANGDLPGLPIWKENKLGNLLLLAGKPQDAEAHFRTAMATDDPRVYKASVAGVARAIRAEDGTVGRANNFILSLKSAKPAATQP